jgi:fibronectin type III domain protein
MLRLAWVTGWVAGIVVVGACSQGAHSLPGGSARLNAAASVPSAALAPAPAPANDGGEAPAVVALPVDEGSPAQQIALPGAPPVTVRPAGPASIEVAVGESSGPRWKAIEVERVLLSLGTRQSDKFERTQPRGGAPTLRHLHAAKPGEQYAYRARSGGAWSPEITVRVPTPGGPPPAPAAVKAQASTPFSVRVTWEADARAAAGFEIGVESKGAFVRAAVVDPTAREFVHHRRLPGRAYEYRVRAFNAVGVSAPSAPVSVTTPELAALPAGAKLPPCTRLPKAQDEAVTPGIPREVLKTEGGRALYNDPERKNHWRRHFYGEYEGCLRDFGAFDLQADVSEVPGFFDEGFPVLHAIAGAGLYAGAEILTLRFARGRYVIADTAYFCGEPQPEPDLEDPRVGTEGNDKDLTTFAPPFDTCQRE